MSSASIKRHGILVNKDRNFTGGYVNFNRNYYVNGAGMIFFISDRQYDLIKNMLKYVVLSCIELRNYQKLLFYGIMLPHG